MGTHAWLRQFVRFAVVGLVATAVQYLVLYGGVRFLDVHPVPASAVGFVASALLNYWLNYRFTFASRLPHRRALPRFTAVVGGGLVLNSLLMWLGVEVLALHYLLAQAATTGLVLIWNFVASRRWAFYAAADPPPRPPGR